jgi:hypothetical protein
MVIALWRLLLNDVEAKELDGKSREMLKVGPVAFNIRQTWHATSLKRPIQHRALEG